MARVQCNTCGGVYDEILPDGLRYFHACPPLSAVELEQAVNDGKVVLPAGETAEDAVMRRVYQRKSARDENVKPGHAGNGKAPIVSPGKGTTPAPPPAPADDPGPVIVDV